MPHVGLKRLCARLSGYRFSALTIVVISDGDSSAEPGKQLRRRRSDTGGRARNQCRPALKIEKLVHARLAYNVLTAGKAAEQVTAQMVMDDLAAFANPERAAHSVSFFKTGKGQYAEGDQFLGLTVPNLRKVALRHARPISLHQVKLLLASPIHEHRLAALEILVAKYERGGPTEQKRIVDLYLRSTKRVNNWDLVDASAPYILGDYLRERPRDILEKLARSKSLWERRIAIVATFSFIRRGEIEPTYRIADMLLSDAHDLIRKAVGWALRETGKVSEETLLGYLEDRYAQLSRTTLRYAIERFPREQRLKLLRGDFR